MRKYLYINIFVLTLVTISLICCDSIFVPDPIDPRLPKYTESGNNVAGAYINQEIWISQDYTESVSEPDWVLPHWYDVVHRTSSITTDSIKNSLILRFDGLVSNDSTSLEFRFVGLNIYSFDDFALLKDYKIQLDGKTNMGVYIRHSGTSEKIKYIKEGGIGQLYFKKVTVVDSTKTATLSGTFGFSITNLNNQIDEISYGRFDFTFQNTVNFVNLKPLR